MLSADHGQQLIYYQSTIPADGEPEIVRWLKEHSDLRLILAEKNQTLSGPVLKIYKKEFPWRRVGPLFSSIPAWLY